MKPLSLILTVLLPTVLFGQTTSFYCDPIINPDTSVSVKNIVTNEKFINGKIDDKYDITIYLKFSNYSDGSFAIYSVSGYYYYNKIKTNIPLVGIYDGGLTLYQFSSKEKEDAILNFGLSGTEGLGFWEQIDKYKNASEFKEKFTIEYQTTFGTWIKNGKTHKLTFNTDDIKIIKEDEYLFINANKKLKTINFRDLPINVHGLQIINFSNDSLENKYLLKYEYSSRSYALGMCGAGSEIGYIILTFDKQYNLIKHENLDIESCNDNIYFEEAESQIPNKKKFKITHFENLEEITKMVILNLKEISFTNE